jgi:hypothetical protein
MDSRDWLMLLVMLLFFVGWRVAKYYDDRDDEIDHQEYARLSSQASLVIGVVMSLIYLGIRIYERFAP